MLPEQFLEIDNFLVQLNMENRSVLLVTATLIELRKIYSITFCQLVKLTWMILEVQQ